MNFQSFLPEVPQWVVESRQTDDAEEDRRILRDLSTVNLKSPKFPMKEDNQIKIGAAHKHYDTTVFNRVKKTVAVTAAAEKKEAEISKQIIDNSPEKAQKNEVNVVNDNDINDSRSPVKNNISGASKALRNEVNTEGANKSHAKMTFFGHLMQQSVGLENSCDNDRREFTRRRRRKKKRRVVPVNHYS